MELLTLTEISKKLDIPESTVRFYRDKFPEFIPMVGEGRKKRYKPQALEIIKTIAELLRKNQTAEEIAERLRLDYPINAGVLVEPQLNTAVVQQRENEEYLNALISIEKLTALVVQLEDKNTKILTDYMELNNKYTNLLEQKAQPKRGFLARLFYRD